MISLYDLSICKAEIKTALKKREWIVTTAHGVDDDYCFNSLTGKFMTSFLEYVTSHSDSIHIDTFENLSKYKIEVSNSVIVAEKKKEGVMVMLQTNLSEEYDYPLTVSITGLVDAQNKIKPSPGSNISVVVNESQTFVTLLPNSSFLIER